MANDSDLYNRWQAAQDYATRVLVEAVKAIRAGKRPDKPAALRRGARRDAERREPRARLPGPVHAPAERERPRPRHRPRRRPAGHPQGPQGPAQGHRHACCTTRSPTSTAGTRCKGPYSPAPEPAGKRALRNAALGYLASRGRAEDMARVARAFRRCPQRHRRGRPRLSMLSELRSPERAKAFERFYERWKDDHLVIDNWFAYQAASPLASALATVEQADAAPAVLDQEPQQGAGADRHLRRRPTPSTSTARTARGYEFVADRVLEIDAFNPQIAARLLSAFRSWKALEPERRRAGQEGAAAHRQGQAAVARRRSRSSSRCWSRVAAATARLISVARTLPFATLDKRFADHGKLTV